MEGLGKALIAMGIILALAGALIVALGRVSGWPRLPGDILIERENLRIYIPLGTSLVISAIATLLLMLWRR